jgi:hypothetical protein
MLIAWRQREMTRVRANFAIALESAVAPHSGQIAHATQDDVATVEGARHLIDVQHVAKTLFNIVHSFHVER